MEPTTTNAKDRIREWYASVGGTEPETRLHLTVLSDYEKRADFGFQVQIQVEIDARAAFWPRVMFETDWPAAEAELVRFFIDGPRHEQQALANQNGWADKAALTARATTSDGDEHEAPTLPPPSGDLVTLHEDD